MLRDVQEDQLKKILIQVEEESISPEDIYSMETVKETGMVCLGEALGER